MAAPAFYERLNDLLKSGAPFVVVTLVDVVGSAPQECGARMLVSSEGLLFGTIGGGKVENRAIDEARRLLLEQSAPTRFFNWNLSADIGMTCGGSVKVFMEVHNLGLWNVIIFGAGHCANALINILITLDCSVTCIDIRPDWLERLPTSARLKKCLVSDYVEGLTWLEKQPEAFVLLLTMGHSTDAPVLLEILKSYGAGSRALPYLGVIGSKAKAHRLKSDVAAAGLDPALADSFFCPVGLELGNNSPHEIAVSIAAQLLLERDRLKG